jgi:hypothetical protein
MFGSIIGRGKLRFATKTPRRRRKGEGWMREDQVDSREEAQKRREEKKRR